MGQSWVGEEISECDLGDARLSRRLGAILEAIGERPGKSLPTAFQDWANTKAAYRFFANGNVSEDKILEGHFAASALRIQATEGPILILQDTTEFSFKRSSPEKIGFTKVSTGHKRKDGRRQKHMICGLLMHASLAITPEGLPLGLTSAKFWSRDKFKGTTALKRKINPTRVPIEQKESMRWLDNLRRSTGLTGAPERCVHIGDRESDIFELYCLAQDLGTNFLVRSCVDRLAEDGDTTIAQVMAGVQSSGTHEIAFRDAGGKAQQAVLSVKFTTMTVRPPIGKQKEYPHQLLQIIHAQELNPPTDRPAIFWKLITNLPVENHTDAVHKLGWYLLHNDDLQFNTMSTGQAIEALEVALKDNAPEVKSSPEWKQLSQKIRAFANARNTALHSFVLIKNGPVQIAWIDATFSVRPRCHLQSFQCATSSDLSPNSPSNARQGVRRMASNSSCLNLGYFDFAGLSKLP